MAAVRYYTKSIFEDMMFPVFFSPVEISLLNWLDRVIKLKLVIECMYRKLLNGGCGSQWASTNFWNESCVHCM
jgi:hypothetical protein